MPSLAVAIWALAIATAQANDKATAVSQQALPWQTDYHAALDLADAQQKMVLLWLFDPRWADADRQFERNVLNDPDIVERVASRYVAIKAPIHERVVSSQSTGAAVALGRHPAFRDLGGSPGVVVLDMTSRDSLHFRRAVSVYPFSRQYLSVSQLAAMLDLPPGSLTERTLMWAVRTHPEAPASTSGQCSTYLAWQAHKHALHQAQIQRQGHHQWDARFQEINAQLPTGLVAQEVCAESWPGQGLIDAANECVDSWRQSPGHWEAVRTGHALFGYDMQRGTNGVWYAAGIFARQPGW